MQLEVFVISVQDVCPEMQRAVTLLPDLNKDMEVTHECNYDTIVYCWYLIYSKLSTIESGVLGVICSCFAECLPTVGAWYFLGAAEERQGETVAGVGDDCHWHQTL